MRKRMTSKSPVILLQIILHSKRFIVMRIPIHTPEFYTSSIEDMILVEKRITKCGEHVLNKIGGAYGFQDKSFISYVKSMLPHFNDLELTRILGTGYCITDLLMLPINHKTDDTHKIQGSFLYMIVVTFDKLTEHNPSNIDLLPSQFFNELALKQIVDMQDNKVKRQSVCDNTDSYLFRLLFLLLSNFEINRKGLHYSQRLHFYTDLISRMYRLEVDTIKQQSKLNYQDLLRRSTLPIIAMAYPYYLANSDTNTKYFTHLLWMYRVGALLGFHDDILDYRSDFENNEANARRFLQDNYHYDHLDIHCLFIEHFCNPVFHSPVLNNHGSILQLNFLKYIIFNNYFSGY